MHRRKGIIAGSSDFFLGEVVSETHDSTVCRDKYHSPCHFLLRDSRVRESLIEFSAVGLRPMVNSFRWEHETLRNTSTINIVSFVYNVAGYTTRDSDNRNTRQRLADTLDASISRTESSYFPSASGFAKLTIHFVKRSHRDETISLGSLSTRMPVVSPLGV